MSLLGIYDCGGVRKQNGHYQSSNLIIIKHKEIFSLPYLCMRTQYAPGVQSIGLSVESDYPNFPLDKAIELTPGKYQLKFWGTCSGMSFYRHDLTDVGGSLFFNWAPGISLYGENSWPDISIPGHSALSINDFILVDQHKEWQNDYGDFHIYYEDEDIGTVHISGDTSNRSQQYYGDDTLIEQSNSFSTTYTITLTKSFKGYVNFKDASGNIVFAGANGGGNTGYVQVCWGCSLSK